MLSPREKLEKFWKVKVASQEETVKRMSTCRSCENFIKATSMCSKCGCYMPFKTKLAAMSCPQGYWHEEPDPSVNKASPGDTDGHQSRSPAEQDIQRKQDDHI